MRGTVRKLSMPRRLVADLMHASMRVPFVSLRRTLHIRALIEARGMMTQPPGFAAIFVKAFCLVAKEQPVLRTLYAKWPWPHFYELPRSVAAVAIARVEDGEDCVLPQKVTAAEASPLTEVDALIRHAKDAPVDQVPAFRKILMTTRFPLPLRRLIWLIGTAVIWALLELAISRMRLGAGGVGRGSENGASLPRPQDSPSTLLAGGTAVLSARAAVLAAFVALLVHTMAYAGFFEDPITWVLLAIGASLAGAARVRDSA